MRNDASGCFEPHTQECPQPERSFEFSNLPSDTEIQVAETNRITCEAGRRSWRDGPEGTLEAQHLFEQFRATAATLENLGWSAERIQSSLEPSRQVFSTSAFMRRCQRWPRGYAGDFETIEYLAAAVNHSVRGTLGWHLEECLLRSAVVQQHLNKLQCQSREISSALVRSPNARILSIACGGCLDWAPVLPSLKQFTGEIVLNDFEPAALQFAEHRLRPVTPKYRLVPGNILRVAKRLASGGLFDLVLAGGLFDYLNDKAAVFLLSAITRDLLAPGGVLLFTNIADGNPWRLIMEYGSNWKLIERTEGQIRELCRNAGIDHASLSMEREPTGLTHLARLVAPH